MCRVNFCLFHVGSFLNIFLMRLGKKDIWGKVSDERFSMG